MTLIGVSAKGVGLSLVEQVFAQKCEELYPEYVPLVAGRQSENDLEEFLSRCLLLDDYAHRHIVFEGQEQKRSPCYKRHIFGIEFLAFLSENLLNQ